MSQTHHRVEFVELTTPPSPWWLKALSRRPRRELGKLSGLISDKCEELGPDGWKLARIQTISASDLGTPEVIAAAWLYFERHDDSNVSGVSGTESSEGLPYKDFLTRVESSFSSIYMTLTSIIQGVALAILAQQAFGFITQVGVSNFSEWASIVPYAVLSLVFVITVAFDYSSLIAVYRWTPRLSDVVFPFGLGAVQIGAAFFLTSPRAWWSANAALAMIGTLAFVHTMQRTKNEMRQYPKIVEYTLITTMRSCRLSVGVSVLSILVATFYISGPKIGYWYSGDLVPALIYMAALLTLLITQDRDIQPAENSPYNLMRQE